jgi:hypothetical protein
MNGHNRIMIYGPKNNGNVRHRIQNSNGETLAISVPRGETRVLKHLLERMPYRLVRAGCSVMCDARP